MAVSMIAAELDPLFAQFQLAFGDSSGVEQISQQQRHVRRLALDDLVAPAQLRFGHLRRARDAHGLTNRRERIAQFVRERGEELILAAIGFAQ